MNKCELRGTTDRGIIPPDRCPSGRRPLRRAVGAGETIRLQMANLITIARLLLLFVVVGLVVAAPVHFAALSMVLIVIVFAGDGLDGWVARKRNATSRFGAVFDIAGDRVVEQVLWILFAYLRAVPLWFPLLVVARGGLVDALRSLSYADGLSAFGENTMMRSAFTRWLTAGRFMRGLYGYAKAVAFVFLTGYVGARQPEAAGTWLASWYDSVIIQALGWASVWLAITLMVVRGIPVVLDALPYARPDPPPAAAPARDRPSGTSDPRTRSEAGERP